MLVNSITDKKLAGTMPVVLRDKHTSNSMRSLVEPFTVD